MQKKSITENIGFADSNFHSFKMNSNHDLAIYFDSWDSKTIKVIFTNLIHFCYVPGDFPANIYEILNDFHLLNKVLSQFYETIPNNHQFKLFQIEDIADFPFIQVVAESISITKE